MKKKMILADLKVESFVTGTEKINGGLGSLLTGPRNICERICSIETFCPSDQCSFNC